VEEDTEEAVHPGLQLLYSINKNLATMAIQRGQYKEALEYYVEVQYICFADSADKLINYHSNFK